MLFVLGLMRSGTSLLYRLLNNHPRVALLYETDLFALTPLLWSSKQSGAWSERLEFWNGALTRHGLTGEAVRRLPPRVHGPAEALLALGQAYARGYGPGTYIGSKSIHHCDRLPSLARAFPAARFVVLWRPLDEIIDSVRRAAKTNAYFAPARRERQLFQHYGDLAKGVVSLRRSAHAVHELLYEELIGNPEAVCHQLCDFLDLPWSAGMLGLNNPATLAAIPDQRHHFHARHSLVGATSTQPLAMAPRTVEKIRCYEQHWAFRFTGQPVRLAASTAPRSESKHPFFVLARIAARWSYRVHQTLSFAKLLIYRFAPLSWLRRYRVGARHAAPLGHGVTPASAGDK